MKEVDGRQCRVRKDPQKGFAFVMQSLSKIFWDEEIFGSSLICFCRFPRRLQRGIVVMLEQL